jgi:hypothetical protein
MIYISLLKPLMHDAAKIRCMASSVPDASLYGKFIGG